jgi:hypothetical protein
VSLHSVSVSFLTVDKTFVSDKIIIIILEPDCGQDSIVGIATHYGLDSLGIESQWGQDFLNPSRPVLGPTQPPVQ